ncbi:bifunctional DNA primase/polymerase, partial [Actinomycetospora sp.]|uniref:bifunctional DNA primase/polymerase n=1 Tax=Actinomycetospora sp. TaxID=1872135 RepID=UPI002F3FE5EF
IRWNATEECKEAEFHTNWRYPRDGETAISSDPDVITGWARAHPGCGFHAPCEPNGLVVPEGDVKRAQTAGVTAIKDGITAWRDAGGPRPAMTVRTPSGGQHWYFAAPEEPIHNSTGKVAPGVDVRGEGGTVFIAGSHVHGHPNGAEAFYSTDRVVPASELSALPPAWERRLREASRGSGRSSGPAAASSSFATPDQFHDRAWIVEQVVAACAAADALTATTEFRWDFYSVAVTLYTAADAGVISHDEAGEVLLDAVRRVWGAEPDSRDRRHVADAKAKAKANPWRVRPDGLPDLVPTSSGVVDEVTGAAAAEGGTTSTNTAATAAERLRDEVGTRWDEVGDDDHRRAWEPIDLGPYIDGTFTPPASGLLYRTDGVGLFYPGLMHWLYGEPESGKSWVAQIAAAAVLTAGGTVLYIDHESDAAAVVERAMALGVPGEVLAARLHYVNPDVSSTDEPNAFAELLATAYDLAVVDGVTMGVSLDSLSSMDNDEITDWVRRVPRRIARDTGAAVVCVDHVVKDKDGRGRFPIGAQAKVMAIDGAGYLVEPETAIRKGDRGEVVLRVAKDRPSGIRSASGEWRQGDRTQEAARIILDATDPQKLGIEVKPPAGVTVSSTGEVVKTKAEFKPTIYMERVSEFLQHTDGPVSKNVIETNVKGKADMIRKALDQLVTLDYVTRRQEGQALRFVFVKRYTSLVDVEHYGQTGPSWQDGDDDD